MNIIGHEEVRDRLKAAVNSGTLSHAHLIIGEDGIGKSIIAKEIAKLILGKSDNKQYVDIIEFKTSKKSIGVDDIRVLIEEINKKPYEGDKKVIVIYGGDKITVQGQNAFLKTVEEPPKGVFIMILCENLQSILDTIRSRCQIHKLNRLSQEEVKLFIDKNMPQASDDIKKTLLSFSDGIPGRCESFFNDETFNEIRELTMRLLNEITKKDIKTAVDYAKVITDKYRNYYDDILSNILYYIRDVIIYKETNDERYILNKDKIYDIRELSSNMSFNKLNSIINNIGEASDNLTRNVNPLVTFDVMLLNMLEV